MATTLDVDKIKNVLLLGGHLVGGFDRASGEQLSPGALGQLGIRAGDVIQEVNRQPVKSIDELRAAVRRTTDKPALLLINRQGADIFVTVKPANG